jgi:hypothetical protein
MENDSDSDESLPGVPIEPAVDASDDDDGVGVPIDSPRAGNVQAVFRGARILPRAGSFGSWVVGAGADLPEVAEPRRLIGFAQVRWLVVCPPDESHAPDAACVNRPRRFAGRVWAHLRYEIDQMWDLADPLFLDDAVDLRGPFACRDVQSASVAADARVGSRPIQNVFGELRDRISAVMVLPLALALDIDHGAFPACVRVVFLAVRFPRSMSLRITLL